MPRPSTVRRQVPRHPRLHCTASAAPQPPKPPFTRHLLDAIELNEDRKPRYAALTANASLPVSNTLVRLERMSLPVGALFDRLARPYREQGIPLLDAEFVPMPAKEAFVAKAPLPVPSPSELPPLDTLALACTLRHALRFEGFAEVAAAADAALADLSGLPQHHCMVRHVLESIRRGAQLAPAHIAAADAAGMKSTESMSRWFILLQILLLGSSDRLDRQAFAIQAQGIPIIQQDVPEIPPYLPPS